MIQKTILISYSSKDKTYAEWLSKIIVNFFDDSPFKVWLDEHDLPFGSRIKEHLKVVINDSDYVITIISPASVKSPWVEFEIETTKELEKKIGRDVLLPLLIQLVIIPEYISERKIIDCRNAKMQELNLKKLFRQLTTTNLPFESSNDFIFYVDYDKVKAEIIKSSHQVTINSPIIGTFYSKASSDRPNFVKVGDKIKKGQVVGIIEAMKLFNEIESEYDGILIDILVEDGQPIEYDQPMYVIQQVEIIKRKSSEIKP